MSRGLKNYWTGQEYRERWKVSRGMSLMVESSLWCSKQFRKQHTWLSFKSLSSQSLTSWTDFCQKYVTVKGEAPPKLKFLLYCTISSFPEVSWNPCHCFPPNNCTSIFFINYFLIFSLFTFLFTEWEYCYDLNHKKCFSSIKWNLNLKL